DPLTASVWRVVGAAGVTAQFDVLARIPWDGGEGGRALGGRARAAVLGPGETSPSGQTAVASDRANRPAASVHH
ncbi:1-acyl-sn-glycerol-3-phosphate acyltransferase, partial [Streptomyces sp. NPDC006863]